MQDLAEARRIAYIGSPVRLADTRISEVYSPLIISIFCAVHIPLAFLMRIEPRVGLIHALLTFGVGLWLTSFKNRPDRVAYAGAYITGAEVLWRMTLVPIFWEFGKYAVAAIFIVSIVARGRLRPPFLPALYFALLVPSVAVTALTLDLPAARNDISFNMSGPFALTICAWFFSQIELSRPKILRLFLALIGPVVGVASIALSSTLTAQKLNFKTASSFVTSGGFGPNQVSAVLGLGALMAFFYVLDKEVCMSTKALLLGIIAILAMQSALTFSRGGLYIAVGSVIAASLFLIKKRRTRMTFLLVTIFLVLLAYYIVIPRLDALSKGALKTRFESTKLTGRDILAQAELTAWQENPILGLGPGGAVLYRQRGGHRAATHTEYTRLLAEHGIFGLYALIILILMTVRNLKRSNTAESRALISALLVWSLLCIGINAPRLVASCFVFGLTFAGFPAKKTFAWPARKRGMA